MSTFGYTPADRRGTSTRDAPSIGNRLANNQVYTASHPLYTNFSSQVAEEMERLRQEAYTTRKTSDKLLITSTLPTEEIEDLNSWFPEFDIATVPLDTPVHALWGAAREAANELTARSVSSYADSVVHLGGSRFMNLLAGRKDSVALHDYADPVHVDNEYRDSAHMHRIFQDVEFSSANAELGFNRHEYDELIQGTSYRVCDTRDSSAESAEAFCADLSVSDISPTQFATYMAEVGAEVGMGFFIYHPSMLVQKSGELPAVGISYRVDEGAGRIEFSYPEGRVGVPSYNLSHWRTWLASHNFCIGAGIGTTWFSLELLDLRGPFITFRMVRLDEPPGDDDIRHALELSDMSEYTLVKSWRIKAGFAGNPDCMEDWEPHDFLVSARVERRVREFAMQLKPEAFKREAIKKQIRVINNRWVMRGAEVQVMPVLDPRDIEALTTAIYTRAFVDRYDSGTLSQKMMERLNELVRFRDTSYLGRLTLVAKGVQRYIWECVGCGVLSGIRDVADFLLEKMGHGFVGNVSVVPPPTYVTLDSAMPDHYSIFEACLECVDDGKYHGKYEINHNAPGAVLATILKRKPRVKPTSAPEREKEVKRDIDDLPMPGSFLNVIRVSEDNPDGRVSGRGDPANDDILEALAADNELDSPGTARFHLDQQTIQRRTDDLLQKFKFTGDLDPVAVFNSAYLDLFPAVAQSKVEHDVYSMSLDPQDRTMEAPYLKMPTYFGLAPPGRLAYASNIVALNIPKKQNVPNEVLNAIAQRNCSAPVISLPQQDDVIIPDIWENFLRTACVPDAKERLLNFRDDPVSCSSDQYADWMRQVGKSSTLATIRDQLTEHHRSVRECDVSQYLAMIKSDVKPTLSEKPVREITAPQVIVYHEKFLSSFYSSIFRVLVRRLISLLKPNIYCNLLKDLGDIESWVSSVHPYGLSNLQYLENDFSKFDKSQSRFVFELEEYVFAELGLNAEMLDKWVAGHVECSVRSAAIGLSLHVLYQRKSGDATTAFGNGLLNMLSVFYAYRDTNILWGVFMGDDSLVCTNRPVVAQDAVQTLAEVFNLSAKYYITPEPYFASTFFLVDEVNLRVRLLPDPIKRIERLSMYISADDPQWDERYDSYHVSLAGYNDLSLSGQLAKMVSIRYSMDEGWIRGLVFALATIANDRKKFRSLWHEKPTLLEG